MLKGKCDHGIVSIGNQMFVIARYFYHSCEVYDSITSKFTLLKKSPNEKYIYVLKTSRITVGNKIYVFIVKEVKKKYIVSTVCYDVIEKSWAPEDICDPKLFNHSSCAKMFKH